jgi:hydrogenase maturation protease
VRSPVVVFGIGNPSRGDDAIGPLLAERLEREGISGVEVLVDFQLQVEHALDLEGRRLVVFIDAAVDLDVPFELRPVHARRDDSYTSHSLSPAAVLETYARITGREPPPAWCLAVMGECFDLGRAPARSALGNAEEAWPRLRALALAQALEAGGGQLDPSPAISSST